MKEYNNFILWFPEGMYRKIKSNPKLERDLDRILEENSFDLAHFNELNEKLTELCHKTIELCKTNKKNPNFKWEEDAKFKELAELQKPYSQEFEEIVTPIYQRMLELGHSKEILTT